MTSPRLSIVVAMAHDNVIGINNDLPWHIPDDLKQFKNLTTGKPVIMGRKTFDSIVTRINKPLPNRKTIVISRSGFHYDHGDVTCVESFEAAVEAAKKIAVKMNVDDIMIAGGAQIYSQSMAFVDRLYITHVDMDVKGDAWFPKIEKDVWMETARIDHTDHSPPFSFVTYDRK